MFVGWTTNGGHDFYVRQLRDGKVIPNGETIIGRLAKFASACGRVLARAHARGGDVAAINDYLGTSVKVEQAFVAFASAYADQNERDHAQFARAVEQGWIPSSGRLGRAPVITACTVALRLSLRSGHRPEILSCGPAPSDAMP